MVCLKGFVQRYPNSVGIWGQKKGALSADVDPGNENQQHFPYKYRGIAAEKMIHDSTTNDRRHTKKHQNTQLSAHIHLPVPPSMVIAQVQRIFSVGIACVCKRELVLNISNNAKLSKANFSEYRPEKRLRNPDQNADPPLVRY
jgi:hypothetical protein